MAPQGMEISSAQKSVDIGIVGETHEIVQDIKPEGMNEVHITLGTQNTYSSWGS